MENPIYIALSRQTALQRQMDVVAHNIANMNTTGYKGQRVLFQEFLDRPAIHEKVSMVQDYGTLRDLRPGALTTTGNQLDVSLDGNGYFVVQTFNGPHYTRSGRFQLNADRQIVDAGGLPVMGANDQPLTIPANASQIKITADGSVTTELGPVGRLRVVSFQREQFMSEVGEGLYAADETPQEAPEGTQVIQGSLEGSNVQPVVEMTNMIEIMRAYQSSQKIMELEHERQRNAITKLGRVA